MTLVVLASACSGSTDSAVPTTTAVEASAAAPSTTKVPATTALPPSSTAVPATTTLPTTTVVPSTTVSSTTTSVPTTTTPPTTTATAATTAPPTTTAVISEGLAAICSFDQSVPKISCYALGAAQGSQLRWESNVAGWATNPSYEFELVQAHQLVPQVVVTLQACQGSSCETVETMIDTSILVPSQSASSTTSAAPSPTVAPTIPTSTTPDAAELTAVCSFDEPQRQLSCQASGHSGGSLKWTTSLGSGWSSGNTFEETFEWGQFFDEIQVQLEECNGSDCSVTTTTLEVELLARGDCPEDFTGWFKNFVLDSVDLVTVVGPPARIIGAEYEPGGYFRVAHGQNDLDVRLPIDATLAKGSTHLFSTTPGVFEVQVGLEFQTKCEGLRFVVGHMADPIDEIAALFTTEPTEDSRDISLPPLEFQAGDLLATTIGFRIDGNAFVGFGVYDDFLRMPTAQAPLLNNAVCFYDFFLPEIASDLLSKTTYHEPSEEGVCP